MQTNLHINKKFEILKNKKEKIAFKTSPRKQINNLDSLPHYDRSLVDYEKYHQYIGHAGVKYSVAVPITIPTKRPTTITQNRLKLISLK